jgi:hypothetical protein
LGGVPYKIFSDESTTRPRRDAEPTGSGTWICASPEHGRFEATIDYQLGPICRCHRRCNADSHSHHTCDLAEHDLLLLIRVFG